MITTLIGGQEFAGKIRPVGWTGYITHKEFTNKQNYAGITFDVIEL